MKTRRRSRGEWREFTSRQRGGPGPLPSSAEHGQALTEYAILTFWLLVALFAPVFDGKSIMLRLVEVFDIYLDSFHTVIMLPVP